MQPDSTRTSVDLPSPEALPSLPHVSVGQEVSWAPRRFCCGCGFADMAGCVAGGAPLSTGTASVEALRRARMMAEVCMLVVVIDLQCGSGSFSLL